jgi:hypothetical protein
MVDPDIVDVSSDTYNNEMRLQIIEDRLMRVEETISAILQGMKIAEDTMKELTREVKENEKNNSTVGR